MKQTYTTPKAQILTFDAADIITVSILDKGEGLSAAWVDGK